MLFNSLNEKVLWSIFIEALIQILEIFPKEIYTETVKYLQIKMSFLVLFIKENMGISLKCQKLGNGYIYIYIYKL